MTGRRKYIESGKQYASGKQHATEELTVSMSTIIPLSREHFEAALELGTFAFQQRFTEVERAERLASMETTRHFGAFSDDEGELAAKYVLLDLNVWVHGALHRMGGIAGVATWPEYRRQGYVARLLVHALETMRSEGKTLSFLFPFSFPFYRKYGWEYCLDYKTYSIPMTALPASPPDRSRVRRISKEDGPSILQPMYDAYAVRYTGMLDRSEAWWRERAIGTKNGSIAVYSDASGADRGYVFYDVYEKSASVHEFVALDGEARRGLLSYLRNLDSMASEIAMRAPSTDPLAFLLPDPRVRQETVPYFSARIVDAAKFVAAMPFAAGAPAAVTLRVRDAHAPWNDGVWTLAVDEAGRGALAPAEAGAPDAGTCLDIGIGPLTAMLLGARRPALLHVEGLLAGPADAVQALERALPDRPLYFADFF